MTYKKRKQKDPAGFKIQDKHFLGPETELQSRETAETKGLLDSFPRSCQWWPGDQSYAQWWHCVIKTRGEQVQRRKGSGKTSTENWQLNWNIINRSTRGYGNEMEYCFPSRVKSTHRDKATESIIYLRNSVNVNVSWVTEHVGRKEAGEVSRGQHAGTLSWEQGTQTGSFMTKFVFWKDHHGCNMEKGMECNKQEIERPQRKPSQR